MKIDVPFPPGSKVYVLKRSLTITSTKCNVCQAAGYVILDKEPLDCPKCHGAKYLETEKLGNWNLVPGRFKTSRLILHLIGKDQQVFLNIPRCSVHENPDNCFTTKAKALAELKRRNRQLAKDEPEDKRNP